MYLFRRRQLDPKTRRIMASGNLCLAFGLMLTLFENHFGHRHPALHDGLRFLLMGCAIGLLLWSARRSGGCASRS
jgi:hypothetical protein